VQRVYAPVDEATLEKVDKDAEGKSIIRAQWVSTAIESYLHLGGANPEEMHHELLQLRTEKEQTWREITHLKRTENVSQLTQTVSQLSLPPGQEVAKKKGWWQFWRRD
jgi:multidrug resistance efflux pump